MNTKLILGIAAIIVLLVVGAWVFIKRDKTVQTLNCDDGLPKIAVSSVKRPDIVFAYCNLPTTDIQGVFLSYASNGTNVADTRFPGGSGSSIISMPSVSSEGTYYLKVLAVMNNREIIRSEQFYIGPAH